MTADLTVHAWDLAAATDGDTELDGELVTAALVFAERLPEDGIPGVLRPAAGRARRPRRRRCGCSRASAASVPDRRRLGDDAA